MFGGFGVGEGVSGEFEEQVELESEEGGEFLEGAVAGRGGGEGGEGLGGGREEG